jgi:hypothetical protein
MFSDLNDIGLSDMDGEWVGEIGLATLLVEPGDESAEIKVGTLELRLTDDQYSAARDTGYELFRLQSVDAGAGWLRVVVRDPIADAAGSLWVSLE